jgi:beta-lactamase regulating signal transducer with metallopeptidase domain
MSLMDVVVRTTVLLLAALVTTLMMRRGAAATRHLVWTLAVVGALLVPVGSTMLPAWRVLPDVRDLPARASDLPAEARDLPAEAGSYEQEVGANEQVASGFRRKIASPLAMALTWAVVAIVLLARIIMGIVAVRRLARHAHPADTRWRLLLEESSEAAGITRRVKLLVSRDIAVPMTWSGGRPTLLLPADAIGWSDERARVVLLHELAHVRRADWFTHLLARVLAALHWFNPLAWIALSAMTRERERACDDFVLAHGARPSEYAQHLLDIAREGIGNDSYAIAPAMARASELEGRLLSILTPHAREPRRLGTQTLTATAICLTIAVASAAPERHVEAPAPAVSPSPATAASIIWQYDDTPEEKRDASRSRAALTPLANTALTDASQDAREKATMALAVRPESDVVTPLLRALKDPSGQVREKAALGLALRRDSRVVDSLLEAANDPDSQVREKVAIALGLSGDARAIAALTKGLEDPDPQVREKAASGLTLLSLSSLVRGNTR